MAAVVGDHPGERVLRRGGTPRPEVAVELLSELGEEVVRLEPLDDAWMRFEFAMASTLLGGIAMVTLLSRRFGAGDVVVAGVGLYTQIVIVNRFGQHFDPRKIVQNYRWVMRLNALSASALGVYLLSRLALSSGQN